MFGGEGVDVGKPEGGQWGLMVMGRGAIVARACGYMGTGDMRPARWLGVTDKWVGVSRFNGLQGMVVPYHSGPARTTGHVWLVGVMVVVRETRVDRSSS